MKIEVQVRVRDGDRDVQASFVVDGNSGYGQNPIIGGASKVLELLPKVIAESVK